MYKYTDKLSKQNLHNHCMNKFILIQYFPDNVKSKYIDREFYLSVKK